MTGVIRLVANRSVGRWRQPNEPSLDTDEIRSGTLRFSQDNRQRANVSSSWIMCPVKQVINMIRDLSHSFSYDIGPYIAESDCYHLKRRASMKEVGKVNKNASPANIF